MIDSPQLHQIEEYFRSPSRPQLSPAQKFERQRRLPGYRSMICEGDSWFRNPTRWVTIPEWLNARKFGADYRFAVLNRAKPGDSALEMAQDIETTAMLVKYYEPDVFALSAGGIDLLSKQNLSSILNDVTASSTVNEAGWDAMERRLTANIFHICRSINNVSPSIPIFWHSYDYPSPSGDSIKLGLFELGPWIKPSMVAKGYVTMSERIKAVRIILNRFSEYQEGLCAAMRNYSNSDFENLNVTFVDLKGTVPDPSDWPDEIHPDSRANKALAKKFKKAITRVIA